MVVRMTLDACWSAIWKLALVTGIAAIAFSLGSTLSVRGQPSGSSIYVCVHRYTGQLRHVPAPERCTSAEYPLSWATSIDSVALDDIYVNEDQFGSITSAMIRDGELSIVDFSPGLLALFNPEGIEGYQYLETGAVVQPPAGTYSHRWECPAGKYVLTGGAELPDPLRLINSYPDSDASWTVVYEKPVEGNDYIVMFYVVCIGP
jgi:hypothetical protein